MVSNNHLKSNFNFQLQFKVKGQKIKKRRDKSLNVTIFKFFKFILLVYLTYFFLVCILHDQTKGKKGTSVNTNMALYSIRGSLKKLCLQSLQATKTKTLLLKILENKKVLLIRILFAFQFN